MCRNCDENLTMRQRTLEGLGLPPVVAVEPDELPCAICGATSTDEHDGESYCDECYSDKFTDCAGCRETLTHDDALTVDGSDYCQTCHDERFACCDKCGDTVPQDDTESVEHRRWSTLCRSCFDDNFFTCAECDNCFSNDSRCSNDNGEDICEGCSENYCLCEGCERYVHNDNAYYSESRGATYCSRCRPSEDEFDAKQFRPGESTYDRIGSRRKFGVELETADCDDYMDLDGEFCFGAKEDGSIDGREFVSTVLYGDAGLAEIEGFCKKANRKGFTVDAKCGFHAHFDVSDLRNEQLRAVACAYKLTYATWASFVSSNRRENHYCGPNDWDCRDVERAGDFAGWAHNRDRYQWFNVAAYARHRTFESRIHSGTLNSEKIVNWVVANLRFIDAVSQMPVATVRERFENRTAADNFEFMAAIWGDELASYFRGRAARFGTEYQGSRYHLPVKRR